MSVLSQNPNLFRKKINKCIKKTCSVKTIKRHLPILEWIPKYNIEFFIQDLIAGITVGLTAIPQGIAYAIVAGLPPEYGLYASLTPGFVYVVFGSCKDVTVGPTAIVSAMLSKYVVDNSADLAILAAFLYGILILIMGIFNLGFLVEFISEPVISGFTTAAALQIAAAQLKSTFGLAGSSGNYFAESIYNFIMNIKTAKLWEPILTFSTIGILILLKKLGHGCKRTGSVSIQLRWFISLARNAVVVVIGMIIAYILKRVTNTEPLAIIGEIGNGLPKIQPPPFSTVINNETYTFKDMVQTLGFQSLTLPFVIILESVAIAKAFAAGVPVDATQEMIALGLCNIIGSFASSMPVTGSFTRTALNHASGVQTTAGGISKCLLLIFALSVMTKTFYYIPKASLAGLIITAMFAMIDYKIFARLWKNSRKELALSLITILVCLFVGLEYGIVTGILIEACILLYTTSRPNLKVNIIKNDKGELIVVQLSDKVSYCAAEYIRKTILEASYQASPESVIVVDATNLQRMDSTVASNLMSVAKDLDRKYIQILFLNFDFELKNMCLDIDPKSVGKFVLASNTIDLLENVGRNA